MIQTGAVDTEQNIMVLRDGANGHGLRYTFDAFVNPLSSGISRARNVRELRYVFLRNRRAGGWVSHCPNPLLSSFLLGHFL